MLFGDGGTLAIPFLLMEGIMASERPSYLLEQQYPYPSLRRSIWSAYGTYRSFAHARAKAARLTGPAGSPNVVSSGDPSRSGRSAPDRKKSAPRLRRSGDGAGRFFGRSMIDCDLPSHG